MRDPAIQQHLEQMRSAGMGLPQGPLWEAFLDEMDQGLARAADLDRLALEADQNRKALDTVTSRLVALMDSIQAGFMVETPDHQIALVNRALCELFHVEESPWGLINREVSGFLEDCGRRMRDPSLIASLVERVNATGRAKVPEISLRDGRILGLDVVPIRMGEESFGSLWMFQDVTQRKWEQRRMETAAKELAEARDKAVELANLKSDFLANMSHEIRTPMNGIIGMAGLLMDAPLVGEHREYLETIRSCGESLMALINDILDFSKIEAGKLVMEHIDFDLLEVVDDVLTILGVKAFSKDVELVCLVGAAVPRAVNGDPVRIRQVLSNLVDNALKFTSQGYVEVKAQVLEEEGEEVLLKFQVEDTGPGMKAEALPRLFQSFSQEDNSTTRNFGGTGLGLAICKRLCGLMGGTIGVESHPGRGSIFWFTLRLHRRTQKAAPATEGLPPVFLAGLPANLYRTLRVQLADWGFQVAHMAPNPESLEVLKRASRAIVLGMLDEGGMNKAFFMALREDPLLAARVRTLVLANRYSASEQRGARHGGFAEVLNVPVRTGQLLDALVLGPRRPDPSTAAAGKGPRTGIDLPRLLLAEDNPVNQRLALAVLKKEGYLDVDVVSNGLEALNAAMAHSYGLILMDCQMPVMEGYEATRQIRERQIGLRRTPIIALTAHAMVGDREKCLDSGMDDYLTKPLKPAALQTMLKKWMDPQGFGISK